MALLRLAGRRLALAVPGLLGVIVVTFLLNRALPGDPAAFFAGPAATRQAIEEIRARLGLDKSVPEQFVYYVRDLARGDLGTSLTTGQPVLRDLATRLPASLELTLAGLTLAATVALPIARMTRASMLGVLGSEFIRTARAAGLAPRTVLVTYALRNALLPVITLLGMVFSFLLGANVLVEKVFAWPGVGSYALEALIASDYAPVPGFVVLVATRLDLAISLSAVTLSFVVGSVLGASAGFFGGWTDRIVTRVTDTIMAFPLFVLAMAIVAALGNTLANIVYATAIINLPFYARMARAEVNVRREAGFVEAARLSGNGSPGILAVHLL